MLKEAESATQGAYMLYVNGPVSSFTTNSALLRIPGPSLRELNRGGVSFIFLPKNGRGHKGLSMRIKNEMWQRLRFIHHYISMLI